MKFSLLILTLFLTACGNSAPVGAPITALIDSGTGKGDDKSSTEPKEVQIAGPVGPQGPQGEKGDKGDTGESGKNGEKGDSIIGPKGDSGSAGRDGIDGQTITGPQGPVGATGASGSNGSDGVSAFQIKVFAANGALVGYLANIIASTSSYWVIDGLTRYEIDQTNGTFPNAYLVYSGINCTGTKRMVITNGKFANVFEDNRDGSLIKAQGSNLGTFNYQSRVAASNSCANTSGSTLVSYDTVVPTHTFVYPMGRLEIEN